MPSIDEYLNPRGRAIRRGTYHVVPNEHANAPRKFHEMMQKLELPLIAGLKRARFIADDARLFVLRREGDGNV